MFFLVIKQPTGSSIIRHRNHVVSCLSARASAKIASVIFSIAAFIAAFPAESQAPP
jgi:hypothetical protein